MQGVRSCSIFLMILLTVVTLGLYINHWVQHMASVLNRRQQRNHISMGLITLFWVVSLMSLLWILLGIVTEDSLSVVRFSRFLLAARAVFTVYMAFAVRSQLNAVVPTRRNDPVWLQGPWTFWFGIYYLQWMINRSPLPCEASVPKAGPPPEPTFDFLAEAHTDSDDD